MGTVKARDLIIQSARKIGVGTPGEVMSAEEMNTWLDAMNVLLKSWSGRSLLTTAQTQESFALTGGKAVYTLGAAAGSPDVTTVKPIRIISAFVRDQNNTDYPVNIISREEYNAFDTKSDQGLPQNIFYDPGVSQQTNQKGTISLYLTPDSTNTYSLFIASEKPFTSFATLDDVFTFQDIYERAIIFNLPLEMAPEYGVTVHPEVISSADEALGIIEAINSSNKRTVSDLGLPGTHRRIANILTGQ